MRPTPLTADDEPSALFALLVVSAVGRSHQGKRRARNEDRFLLLDRHNLFVVADGMGGYVGGQVAAQLAVDTVAQAFDADDAPPGPAAARLTAAYEAANHAVFARGESEADLRGMGTTLVGARFLPRRAQAWIAHVGDSRCYRLRGGVLEQLTVDHAEANGLTRAIGADPDVTVDVTWSELQLGDRYLLCSDGLTKMVPDEQIRGILNRHADLDAVADALIQRANARGGKDNVTVVVVGVTLPGVGVVPHDRDEEAARIAEARRAKSG